ncbi:hypothetical protein [Planomicrobium sp. YIM 101495]|uniref:hypothetical protein n=1 Tax=Planomicrobium sp. YIM 101495 TaxID=2665160 RepID=UPI0012B99606|nr:hypothetical protein [Planomicrobium sp. YIM 101495]MTD30172.1 hypothetical protein [Planomicrobium sp. YIM 101495]
MILLEYLKEFQGVIGVLLGIIFSLGINVITKNWGTVQPHVDYFKDKANERYLGPDPSGDGRSHTVGYDINSGILFENTSEVLRAIYDLKFVIHSESKDYEVEIEDAASLRSDQMFKYFDKVRHLNIGPKQMFYLKARANFNLEDIPYKTGDKVSISYNIANKKLRGKRTIELNNN